MNLRKIAALSLFVAASGAVAYAVVSSAQSSTLATQSDYDNDALHKRPQYLRSLAANQIRSRVEQFGLETNAAGIHVVHPKTQFGLEDVRSGSIVADFTFVGMRTTATYEELAAGTDPIIDDEPMATLKVSAERLLATKAISDPEIVASSMEAGKFAVRAPLTDELRKAFETGHGALSGNSPFIDWAGRRVVVGDTATQMKASVVSNGIAYSIFDVTAVLNSPMGTPWVTIAEKLELNEAQDLVALLD